MMRYLRDRGAVDKKDNNGKLPSDFLSERKKFKEEMENFSKAIGQEILTKVVPPSSASNVAVEALANIATLKSEPSHSPISSHVKAVNDNKQSPMKS